MHKYKGFEIVKIMIPQTYKGRSRVLPFYQVQKNNQPFNMMGEYSFIEAKASIDAYLITEDKNEKDHS